MNNNMRLTVEGIEKSFPGVKALDNINFSVKPGSVHVLCGENGAGKSTLMKIINGIYKADKGNIYIDGQQVVVKNPQHARELGVSMIFQELNYIPEMTIEENLFLGNLPKTKFGRVDWKKIREKTLELLEAERLSYKPTTKLCELSVSDIQMLEITKAVSYESKIIIMDEPTSAITYKETERLFTKISELKARGTSIIYISHKMDEIFRIADEITVLRDGTVIETHDKDDIDINTVIKLMVGRELSDEFPKEEIDIGEKVLEVKNLTRNGFFHNVNFNAKRGEIIGFSGLMGAGRTEVMRCLFGLDETDNGTILINNKPIKIPNVRTAIKAGLAMLSEDRRRYGIIPVRSVKENATLASLPKFFYSGRLHRNKENATTARMFKDMNVKTPTFETTIQALSGGNQQKVLLAKWMICDPDILILDEPTRGIDVGAKYEIYKLMMSLVKEGKTLIMISSELPELIGMCDRMYVMAKGEITGELQREEFSQEAIMKFATGFEKQEAISCE